MNDDVAARETDDVAEQERTLQCPECSRRFAQPHALGKHRRSAHNVPGQSRRRATEGPKKACPVCGKLVAERNSQWMTHMRTHPVGSRRWVCVVPYWEWEYRLERLNETGPTVRLTRTEATRDTPTVYTVYIEPQNDGGDVAPVVAEQLAPIVLKEAQAEAVKVFKRHAAAS